ncbi:MAG TPA: PA14 domain-containing protein, partial [Ilumatobacteraceae bacterium]
FAGWAHGRQIAHTLAAPEVDTTYTATYVPSEPFDAAYYDNTTFSGAPVLTRQDQDVDFHWGEGSPAPGVPADVFAARWTKTQFFGAGRYRFTVSADDGIRLYLDNQLVIDAWAGSSGTPLMHDADFGTGNHSIKVEYQEHFGAASARVVWTRAPDQPNDTYLAEYWNMAPESVATPAIPFAPAQYSAAEFALDHVWGEGSPAPGIGPNKFVARWTRTMSLAPGDYRFRVTADDGVRLIVDGVRVIDRWIDQPPTTYERTLPMDGSPHNVVMEYYENSGGATAQLDISQVGEMTQPSDWHAEYWNHTPTDPFEIPTRTPDVVRSDPSVAFEWFGGSPAPTITDDNFIARWTRTDTLSAGRYRFSGTADDGLRVFVDDVPIVDMWHPQHTNFSVDVDIPAGTHAIRVEYFESGGDAAAVVDYARIGGVGPHTVGFAGEYFDNRDLSGTALVTRHDETVDYDWGIGSPDPTIPVDNFSARWTQTTDFAEGNYVFSVTADDGVRLYVDGHRLIDKWIYQGPTTYTTAVALPPGEHTVVMEYFEAGGGAVARLDYHTTTDPAPPLPSTGPPITAEYFTNTTLSGTAALTRVENAVDHTWGIGSPDPTIPVDNFSARWTQTTDFAAGTYHLSATGDDGIRVFVDGQLAIDGWADHAATTYTTGIALTEGSHAIVVEYYEHSVDAIAKFSITPA